MTYLSKIATPTIAIRTVRIVTGLYLLAYVTSHLLNLSLGLISIQAMNTARPYLSGFWTGGVAGLVLGIMLVLHYLIGLWTIFRKPVLNGTTKDMVQVLTGVFVIPLMATHVIGVSMLGKYGVHLDYQSINQLFWLFSPEIGLLQVILVSVVWVHGCAGLFTWLRSKSDAVGVLPWLYPLAVAVPVLALLGYVQAGRAVLFEAEAAHSAAETSVGAGYGRSAESYATDAYDVPTEPEPDTEPAPEVPVALIKSVTSNTIWGSLGLAALVFLARAVRLWLTSASHVRIVRGDARPIEASSGVSLLDAFRSADQPHANLCSGRGRCGTCAVRVVSSDIELPEPSPLERATLDRIGRGSDSRLACQLRLLGEGAIEVAAIYPADYSFSDSEPGQDETGGAIEATQ